MPYTTTRRSYNMFGKKISRYFSYMKAKRIYSEISREMSAVEARFLKSRLNHA